ncbi:MAG: hypothetical protein ACKOCE_03000 [Acidimicrobiia bacterium]
MVTVLVVILVVCLLVVIGVATTRRTPASDDRVADFRRHLDALSPEAHRAGVAPIATPLEPFDRGETFDGIDDAGGDR